MTGSSACILYRQHHPALTERILANFLAQCFQLFNSAVMARNYRSYHCLLTSLSQRLSKDDLKNLIFSCGDVLPPFTAEKITAGTDFFRELKQRGHLGPTNYDYLREKLVLVGRNDLASELPDQLEILFGQASDRSTYFGCVASRVVPVTVPVNFKLPKCCPPDVAHRMFLMCLCEQLTSEEIKKLAFLMCPSHDQDQITAFKLANFLEREESITSVSFIGHLSTCLEAVGRADLAQFLDSLKAPQALLSSLSASQQQLDLKISLFLHSKQQSYDFHMRALAKVENDENARTKLLIPLATQIYKSFSCSSVLPLAQDLQVALQNWSHSDDFDSLIGISLLKVVDFNETYITKHRLFENCKEICLESLHEINEKCHESYQTFDSLMDLYEWSPEVRSELRKNARHRTTPFGTPADLACQYILELCQETCWCNEIQQEKQLIEEQLHTLHSTFTCCCCNVVLLQWLATLLCLSTSSAASNPLNLSKHKDFLLTTVERNKDDIIRLYHFISQMFGQEFMQKVSPLLETVGISQPTEENELLAVNPLTLFFHVFLIKLLAVASLGPDYIGKYDAHLTNNLLKSHISHVSRVLMTSAAAMKKQVEAFREKALAEDRLCRHLIASLTTDDY